MRKSPVKFYLRTYSPISDEMIKELEITEGAACKLGLPKDCVDCWTAFTRPTRHGEFVTMIEVDAE